MASLYIVATPIGNLEDITLRALSVLKEVDLVLAEDTRVTRKLFLKFNISTPLQSFHQHSDRGKVQKVLTLLTEGKNVALVSDAGTPGIQDPGGWLVGEVLKNLPDVKIIPIPGPSSLTAVASIAGFNTDKFLFLGFPPHKKGRNKFFEEIKNSKYPVIFFESPYRIIKALESLKDLEKEIVVCRELTKKFETVYRGKASEVLETIKKETPRGEFVIIIS